MRSSLRAPFTTTVVPLPSVLTSLKRRIAERTPTLSDTQLMSVTWSLAALNSLDALTRSSIREAVKSRGRALDKTYGSGLCTENAISIAGVSIVRQLDSCLVINKPPGMVVSLTSDLGPRTRRPDAIIPNGSPELQRIIAVSMPFPISKDVNFAHGILHRLDKDTSGAILVATSFEAFYDMRFQFAAGMMDKEYLCLVNGTIERIGEWRRVDSSIVTEKRDRGPVSMKSEVSTGAKSKSACTEYCPVSRWRDKGTGKEYTSVRIRILSGRSHQIRVHMSSIGHPLIFDSRYGDNTPMNGDERIFLHASRIGFTDPASDETVVVRVPLADDLERMSAERMEVVRDN